MNKRIKDRASIFFYRKVIDRIIKIAQSGSNDGILIDEDIIALKKIEMKFEKAKNDILNNNSK